MGRLTLDEITAMLGKLGNVQGPVKVVGELTRKNVIKLLRAIREEEANKKGYLPLMLYLEHFGKSYIVNIDKGGELDILIEGKINKKYIDLPYIAYSLYPSLRIAVKFVERYIKDRQYDIIEIYARSSSTELKEKLYLNDDSILGHREFIGKDGAYYYIFVKACDIPGDPNSLPLTKLISKIYGILYKAPVRNEYEKLSLWREVPDVNCLPDLGLSEPSAGSLIYIPSDYEKRGIYMLVPKNAILITLPEKIKEEEEVEMEELVSKLSLKNFIEKNS